MKNTLLVNRVIQFIFVLILISCKGKNIYEKRMVELYKIANLEIYDEIDFSKGFIEKNKPYEINHYFYTFVYFNDKWQEVLLFLAGGGEVIFEDTKIKFSGEYHDVSPWGEFVKKDDFRIIDENNNLIVNDKVMSGKVKIGIINEFVVMQFDNNFVKHIFEIEGFKK
jgi:hypothetical protein